MKKIIHLTDTHIGYKNLSTRMGDIVTRIIFQKQPAKDYVIVHTGDVVEDATREGSYEEALAHMNRLRKAGFHLLYSPGNHDYGTGFFGSPKYVDEFKQAFFGTKGVKYPKVDVLDGIAFIGLDSMAEELSWYDRLFAEGELGDPQLARLAKALNSKKVSDATYRVVYLHHHPFHPKPFHHLKDSQKLGNLLQGRKIHALLFGHNHDGHKWNGKWGIPRVYDGGTSTGKKGMPCPHRVIDLSRDPSFDYDAEWWGPHMKS